MVILWLAVEICFCWLAVFWVSGREFHVMLRSRYYQSKPMTHFTWEYKGSQHSIRLIVSSFAL